MQEVYRKFIKESEKKAFNLEHRNKINFNISKYDVAVEKGKKQYKDLDLAKKRAASIKHKVINELEKYLLEFVANFEKGGGKVIWAQDKEEAVNEILTIMKRYNAKKVVKSKSMITEEIEINEALEKNNIESLETDLGEYIVQIAGEKPYHIVTPAMHKSRDDVAKLFHEKFNTPRDSTPSEITLFVREKLRDKFLNADIGITGGNFLIADTGAVCLTENEGNALMSVSFPKVHIAVVGIEKIIPSLTDLDLFWPLLASHGTGQNITVYNSVISGPRQGGETDGPDEMYLVLLDNNRSELLKHNEQRAALTCIRCGACLNACPVYKNIGGHTYATTYSGPIGSVITPHLKGMNKYKHLSFSSSLCGNCTEVCSVKIPLHELLLYNRNDSVKAGYSKTIDKISMYGMKKILLKRKRMDMFNAGMKNIALRTFIKKVWGPRRELPVIAKKSFRELWLQKKGLK
ncbi:MAG: iron-sulfur cluster-binding protein [Bacteroidetes bacterium]|nr:iron-sulfur cluster-binding protein [Bacteroidota bacterium]MBL7104725.1 iron-sulfur cluster-binding protein [Bacteroidales bacterium]